jgi:hypothetical protein
MSSFSSTSNLGKSRDFFTSLGLLSEYYTSQMLARDVVTIMHDVDEFGADEIETKATIETEAKK